jgi:hypothetical protein
VNDSGIAVLQAFLTQPLPWLALLLALSAAFLMGFARSGLGTGGFVVSPLMVFALGPSDGLAVVAVLMLPAALLGVWQHRGEGERRLLQPLVLGMVLGTALGGLALWALVSGGDLTLVHRRMEVLVALLSLLYVALVAGRNAIARAGGGGGPAGPTGLLLVGSGVGISQTVANSGSPLLTVFFLRHQVPRSRFVAAQLVALLVQNLLKLIPLISLGILHLGNAGSALLLIPVTVIGNLSGQRFYRGASERLFFLCYQVLLLIGFAVSVALIVGRSRILALL